MAETGGGPNGAAIGPDGAIYVTNNGGSFEFMKHERAQHPRPDAARATRAARSSASTSPPARSRPSTTPATGRRRLNGPNDLVFDKQGGIWFTDHGCGDEDGRKCGGLYYAKPDGSKITRARDHLISPNGVGLSPDEKVVYVADTNLGRLWAFDVAAPGELGAAGGLRARPGDLQPAGLPAARQPGGGGRRQGLRGHHHQRRRHRLRPRRLDRALSPFPDLITTNICFGGADMRDAWVTCSSTGKLFKCRWPRPGLKLNFNA